MAPYTLVDGHEGFLGQGAFGVVEKVVKDSTGEVFACKTIRFQDGEKHREPAEREYSILSRLDHPNVVKYVDIIWASTSAKIYMSICAGGSLADVITRRIRSGSTQQISNDYLLSVFHQLSAALLYCHNGLTVGAGGSISGNSFDWNPVLHRDIKPGNIMLSTRDETEDVVVKIGDFGLSTFLEDERAPSTYAGTKEYLAPVSSRRLIELARSSITKFKEQEINRYREGKNHWTKACDVFSLGCTMYELANLKPPFFGHMDDDDTIEPLPDNFPSKFTSRVMACMSYQPERRPDAVDILRSIKWHKAGLGPSPTPGSNHASSVHGASLASPKAPKNQQNLSDLPQESVIHYATSTAASRPNFSVRKPASRDVEMLPPPSTSKPKDKSFIRKLFGREKSNSDPSFMPPNTNLSKGVSIAGGLAEALRQRQAAMQGKKADDDGW